MGLSDRTRWHCGGQGLESCRLHHPSLAAQRRAKDGALHSVPAKAGRDRGHHAASYGWQAIPEKVFYTYILESCSDPAHRYIGHAVDLKARLLEHNAGKCSHTAKYRPWKIKLYLAFETLKHAQHFELYLKSGSGHAFANKHFWVREVDSAARSAAESEGWCPP
jgi:putative endonuclease